MFLLLFDNRTQKHLLAETRIVITAHVNGAGLGHSFDALRSRESLIGFRTRYFTSIKICECVSGPAERLHGQFTAILTRLR